MTAGRYERRHSGKGRAVPKRRLSCFYASTSYKGAKMIINIDLDSWEVGYADGHFGRHLKAQPVSTRFRIRLATVWAVQVMREPIGINLPAGAR